LYLHLALSVFLIQQTSRQRDAFLTPDHANFDQRAMDCHFVVEWTTKLLYFLVLTHDDKKLIQSESWKAKFYEDDNHEEIVRKLEERNISVFAVTFMLYCVLSHLNLFSKKQ